MSDAEVRSLVDSRGWERPSARRADAMVRCALDLGLRSGEIADLLVAARRLCPPLRGATHETLFGLPAATDLRSPKLCICSTRMLSYDLAG